MSKKKDKNEKKKQLKSKNHLQKERLNLLVFVASLIIISVVFFNIIKIFFVPLILAVTFSTLLYPLYKLFLRLLKNRTLSSILFCFLIIICILVPLYFIGNLVIIQGIEFYNTLEKFINTTIENGDSGLIGDFKKSNFFRILRLNEINWESMIRENIKSIGKIITTVINKTSTGVLGMVANIFFTFYAMFYFFRDGDKIISKLRHLSPLRDEYEEKLISRFGSISRATVKGTVIIGIIQGIAGTLTFVIFGIKGWILWGVVMIILSIIPLVGSYLVMVPVAVYKIATGHIWQGIIIIFAAIVLNYAIDYLLRPILVGHESKMHDLLIFFSTLGGIIIFGVMGFIIGPMIAMIFITLLDIYSLEFKELLH